MILLFEMFFVHLVESAVKQDISHGLIYLSDKTVLVQRVAFQKIENEK